MKEVDIRLNTVEEVSKFVDTVSRFEGKAEIRSDRYEIDAKSLLGMFSLDLTKPLRLRLYRPTLEAMCKINRYRISA